MIGGRSALLGASGGLGYGNWEGNYSDVSLLLRGNGAPALVPLDESPTPKTLTVFGNAGISTTTFKYGDSALAFDGSGDYLKAADSNDFALGSGNLAIEAWIYQVASPSVAAASITSNLTDSGTREWLFGVGLGNTLRVQSWFTAYESPGSVISNNKWHHVAWTRSGSTNRLFVDGVIVHTFTDSRDWSATSGARIGAYGAGNYLFNGFIDDLRITKGIARYTKNFLPPPAQLPAI